MVSCCRIDAEWVDLCFPGVFLDLAFCPLHLEVLDPNNFALILLDVAHQGVARRELLLTPGTFDMRIGLVLL
jgi:hypothetical protein